MKTVIKWGELKLLEGEGDKNLVVYWEGGSRCGGMSKFSASGGTPLIPSVGKTLVSLR